MSSIVVVWSIPIQCVDHYLYFTLNVNVNQIVCWNTGSSYVVTPPLPEGLVFVNGTINGTAKSISPLQKYTVHQSVSLAYFWLAGNEYIHSLI